MNNPILPTKMPKGYGCVAIIWNKTVNHLILALPDGSERIQCVELTLGDENYSLSKYISQQRGTNRDTYKYKLHITN